jgi:hypothetical protein
MESDPEIPVPSGNMAVIWAGAASRVARLALVFCGVVLALLLFNAGLVKKANPYNHPEMASMLERLQRADSSGQSDESSRLIRGIRDLDSAARTQFFQAHAAERHGWVLLVAGAAVFLLASKTAAVLRRAVPMPPASAQAAAPAVTIRVTTAVAVVMAATALALLIASCSVPDRAPRLTSGGGTGGPAGK